MIYELVSTCSSGLDLLTVWLLFIGFNQKEVAQMLSTTESVVSRRLHRIRRNMGI